MGLMLDALKRIDERLSAEWPQEQPAICEENLAISDSNGQPTESWTDDIFCGEIQSIAGTAEHDGGMAGAAVPESASSPPPTVEDVPCPEPPGAGQTPPLDTREPLAAGSCLPPSALPSAGPSLGPYQDLASRILAELTPGRPRALAFTSPADGPETTAVLVRLAPVLAEQVEGGVLLVDADFRRPRLAAEFGVEARAGLSEVLAGEASWSDAVRPTAVPRLHLLPGGPVALQEGRAAEPPDLERLLRDLLRHYALLLVGAGSLAHPEAAEVAGACEGTYLVARLGQTTRPAVRQAAQLIQRCHARLLGCVAVGSSS
jgi:Mrp family chromosome partitioning ATPase